MAGRAFASKAAHYNGPDEADGASGAEVAAWVLRKPPLDERIGIEQAMDRAARALPQLLAGQMSAATHLIHTSAPPRPKPPRPAAPSAPDAPSASSGPL